MDRASLSRRGPGLVALWLGVSVPGPGLASTSPAIVWDAPAGCADAGGLTTEIERHVEREAMARERARVHVRVREDGERWSVAVAIEAEGGSLERTLDVESCEAAVRAAGFVIAIAVDPARREPQELVPPPPPAPEGGAQEGERTEGPGLVAATGPEVVAAMGPEASGPGEVTPFDPPLEDPRPAPPRRRSLAGLVQIGPAVQVGMLPPSAGLNAAAGLLGRRVRLVVGYTRWFGAEVRRAGERAYGAQFAVDAGHVRIGPRLRAGPVEVPLHVGVELGALRGRGTGGDVNYTAGTLWGAATLGAGLTWAPRALRGHAALVVLAEAALSLRRPRFVFADDLPVHQVGPAAFRGFVQVEARFP